MGNETSRDRKTQSMRNARQASVTSEDAPYIASASKPIGSPKKTTLQKAQSLGASVRLSSPKRNKGHHIVTVNEGTTDGDVKENDPAVVAMYNIPRFTPIIKDTIRNPIMKEIAGTTRLNINAATDLVARYQNLLRAHADKTSREQQHLGQRTTDMDYAIGTLHQVLVERSKKLSRQTDQFNTVSQMQALLNSTRMCLKRTTTTLALINGCLPEEHRLTGPDLQLSLETESND